MSESDTMFNERNRRCVAVQLMHSTDPSYDNRTIASTLKMQIWIATNNRDVSRVMKTKFPATVMVFGVVSSESHIMPPHIFAVGLVIRRELHQHDLPQHQSQCDRRHLPSIRRASAGACGKGMLPVPDPYRGGDWGWRRLYWIDASSTT